VSSKDAASIAVSNSHGEYTLSGVNTVPVSVGGGGGGGGSGTGSGAGSGGSGAGCGLRGYGSLRSASDIF
jgi:hypothetical protein